MTGRVDVCSTPYGITEVGTARTARSARRARRVLNALRHHRGRHVAGGRVPGATLQVLNALRHHRGRHRSQRRDRPRSPRSGAQRLTASQRSAHAVRNGRRPPAGDVLNALRHHRGRHADRSSTVRDGPRVLNALRHHRGRHARPATAVEPASRECSTPFGITEVGTARSRQLDGTDDVVLNAFRHHRGRHAIGDGVTRARAAMVLNALRHHRGRHARGRRSATRPASSAQRLSASQRSAHVSVPASQRPWPRVLNALRHHRGRHQRKARPARAGRRGAQRLTASQRSARHASVGRPAVVRRGAQRLTASQRSAPSDRAASTRWARQCSTPYGITEVGTQGRDRRVPESIRCSTP